MEVTVNWENAKPFLWHGVWKVVNNTTIKLEWRGTWLSLCPQGRSWLLGRFLKRSLANRKKYTNSPESDHTKTCHAILAFSVFISFVNSFSQAAVDILLHVINFPLNRLSHKLCLNSPSYLPLKLLFEMIFPSCDSKLDKILSEIIFLFTDHFQHYVKKYWLKFEPWS